MREQDNKCTCACCGKPTFKWCEQSQPEDAPAGWCASCGFEFSGEFEGSPKEQAKHFREYYKIDAS
jgi:hypothetical protein